MATQKSVWGVDIGQVALKALKLRSVDGELQVEAFDIIEHAKILSQPDADRDQLIRVAMEQFLARNNTADSTVVVSVPGQASFTRFVKLPPVEEKKIPDIVRFEAEQQIPFPINDVIWRWQTFHDTNTPDVELGIFAMKRVDIDEMLSHFSEVGMGVDCVQMAPLSLYNFMLFDGQLAEGGATLLADVGADKTDLVVSDGTRMWTRTVQIGGNNFTEALVRAFKLSFVKAEKLKRTAASSKYARQIFQAMRPVFSDLVQEIQRSIGFYTSLHRETRFKKLIGLGNGFRLPGLQKFLEQNLNVPVARIDSYNKITASATINTPAFTENVLSFAVAYGLALQGLGLTVITTNLLPQEVSRGRSWERKKPWFAAAAACLLAAIGLYGYRGYADATALATSKDFEQATGIVEGLDKLRNDYQALSSQGSLGTEQLSVYFKMFGYHNTCPAVLQCIAKGLAVEFPDQEMLSKLGTTDGQAYSAALAKLASYKRSERSLLYVNSLRSEYVANIDATSAAPAAAPGAPVAAGQEAASGKQRPGFIITIEGRTPLSKAEANRKRLDVKDKIRKAAADTGMLEAIDVQASLGEVAAATPAARPPAGMPRGAMPGAAVPTGPLRPDPLFPTEDMSQDTPISITIKIAVESDGVKVPDDAAKSQP
jgi:type IV pilus assembly protein PilM